MYKLKQNTKTATRYSKLQPMEADKCPTIDFQSESDISIFLNDEKNKIAVLFAINPRLVEEFISSCGWYSHYFVLYPNNTVYWSLFNSYNFTRLHKEERYKPIAYDNFDVAKDSLLSNLEKQKFISRGTSIIVLDSWTDYRQEFDNYMTSLEYLLKHENMNMNTNHIFNEKILKNQYMNVFKCFNNPTISELQGKVTTPIVCIGAGTSLEKNIGFLKEIQNEVFIICCVNALNIVDSHGVKPDLVTTLDMMESMTECCKKFYDIPIVQEASAQDLTPYFSKTYISLSAITRKRHLIEFLNEHGIDTSSSEILTSFSVAFYNIFLGLFLGASKIILLGQDLAFDGEKTHAEGYAWDFKVDKTDRILVDGYYGDKVETDYTFNLYREFLEHRVRIIDTPIINATEGGSYIKGCEHISLKEAYEKYIKGTEKPIITHKVFKSDFNVQVILDMLINTENAIKSNLALLEAIMCEDSMPNPNNYLLNDMTVRVNVFKDEIMKNKFLIGVISEHNYTLFAYYEYLRERQKTPRDSQEALRIFFLSALQMISLAKKGINNA